MGQLGNCTYCLGLAMGYHMGMGREPTHHRYQPMTYAERRALAAKRLANPSLYTRNAEQVTDQHQAAREARSRRVEDNGIIWVG